jgi:hypothetical protein
LSILLNNLLNPAEFVPTETPAPLKPHGIQPELGSGVIPLNVNVRWLITITCVEEEPIGTNT